MGKAFIIQISLFIWLDGDLFALHSIVVYVCMDYVLDEIGVTRCYRKFTPIDFVVV